jgi:hypothetical protein
MGIGLLEIRGDRHRRGAVQTTPARHWAVPASASFYRNLPQQYPRAAVQGKNAGRKAQVAGNFKIGYCFD